MPGYYLSNALVLLYNEAKGICHLCNKFVPIQQASRDHRVPQSSYKGTGMVPANNISLAHKQCNNERGNQELEIFFSASRPITDPSIAHTHSKKSAIVPDEELERAKLHEESMRKAIKNIPGEAKVLGTANKRWRCTFCGEPNESEEITIQLLSFSEQTIPTRPVIKKVSYCWHCSNENVRVVGLKTNV